MQCCTSSSYDIIIAICTHWSLPSLLVASSPSSLTHHHHPHWRHHHHDVPLHYRHRKIVTVTTSSSSIMNSLTIRMMVQYWCNLSREGKTACSNLQPVFHSSQLHLVVKLLEGMQKSLYLSLGHFRREENFGTNAALFVSKIWSFEVGICVRPNYKFGFCWGAIISTRCTRGLTAVTSYNCLQYFFHRRVKGCVFKLANHVSQRSPRSTTSSDETFRGRVKVETIYTSCFSQFVEFSVLEVKNTWYSGARQRWWRHLDFWQKRVSASPPSNPSLGPHIENPFLCFDFLLSENHPMSDLFWGLWVHL